MTTSSRAPHALTSAAIKQKSNIFQTKSNLLVFLNPSFHKVLYICFQSYVVESVQWNKMKLIVFDLWDLFNLSYYDLYFMFSPFDHLILSMNI